MTTLHNSVPPSATHTSPIPPPLPHSTPKRERNTSPHHSSTHDYQSLHSAPQHPHPDHNNNNSSDYNSQRHQQQPSSQQNHHNNYLAHSSTLPSNAATAPLPFPHHLHQQQQRSSNNSLQNLTLPYHFYPSSHSHFHTLPPSLPLPTPSSQSTPPLRPSTSHHSDPYRNINNTGNNNNNSNTNNNHPHFTDTTLLHSRTLPLPSAAAHSSAPSLFHQQPSHSNHHRSNSALHSSLSLRQNHLSPPLQPQQPQQQKQRSPIQPASDPLSQSHHNQTSMHTDHRHYSPLHSTSNYSANHLHSYSHLSQSNIPAQLPQSSPADLHLSPSHALSSPQSQLHSNHHQDYLASQQHQQRHNLHSYTPQPPPLSHYQTQRDSHATANVTNPYATSYQLSQSHSLSPHHHFSSNIFTSTPPVLQSGTSSAPPPRSRPIQALSSRAHSQSPLQGPPSHNVSIGETGIASAPNTAHEIANNAPGISTYSHAPLRQPDDVDVAEDIMTFGGQPTSTSLQSNAFASEPLTAQGQETASVMDALLPDTEHDAIHMNVPLQIPLSTSGPVHDSVRLNTGGSTQGLLNNSIDSGTQPSFPLMSQSIAGVLSYEHPHATQPSGVPPLQSSSSLPFSMAMGVGTKDSHEGQSMLLLGRHEDRNTQNSHNPHATRNTTRAHSEQEHTLGVENGMRSGNASSVMHAQTSGHEPERRVESNTLEAAAAAVAVAAVSKNTNNNGCGLTPNQMSIQDLTKPKIEAVENVSQEANFSPSSPAYSAVTISSPTLLQSTHGITPSGIGNGGGGVTAVGLNAAGAPMGLNDTGATTTTTMGVIDGGVPTVTQSNIGTGSGQPGNSNNPSTSGLSCPICKTQFTRRYNLKVHMTSKHSARRDYHCKQCPNAFNRGDSLKRHIATTHRGEKKWTCTYCNRNFGQRPHMKMHIDTVHLKKRDHKCHCGKAFGTRYNLTAHQRTHQQTPKKHVCGICKKSFALKSSLARHQRNSSHCQMEGVVGVDQQHLEQQQQQHHHQQQQQQQQQLLLLQHGKSE